MENNVKHIFLDSNLMIRLAFIDSLVNRGATDSQIIYGLLNINSNNSMRGNEQAANNLVAIYHDIVNEKVRVCLLPKVFKEIWKPYEYPDEINFYKDHCTVVMPRNYTLFLNKTAKLTNRLNDPQYFSFEKLDHNHQKFGLCDEPIISNNGEVSEHNDFSDRLLLAQLGVLSSMAGEVFYIRCDSLNSRDRYNIGCVNIRREDAENLGVLEDADVRGVTVSEKPFLFYHFNALDIGSRANEGFGYNNPIVNANKKILENNIERTLNRVGGNVKIRQIAEMERE